MSRVCILWALSTLFEPTVTTPSPPLDLEQAAQRIRARIQPVQRVEQATLLDALGRVLAEPLHSPIDLPPFDNSAMDGYAVCTPVEQDVKGSQFRRIGVSAAGHPFTGSIRPGECVRIFTGAATPAGTQRILLQEDCDAQGDTVVVSGTPEPRSNIRSRGNDLTAGSLLDPAGVRVNAFRVGRYAASGIDKLTVFARPTVGVFSTGDELAPIGTPAQALPPGSIYESNRHALMALMAGLPVIVEDLGSLPDDPAAIRSALVNAARRCDVIVTSGGVSVGDHDHVKAVVESLGSLDFWRLNLKPGKPLAFGRLNDALFFGLPGNPVSTIITWLLIAQPAVLALCGAQVEPPARLHARLTCQVRHSPGRTEYQRGRYDVAAQSDGLAVDICGDQASNRLSSFDGANCLVEIPADAGDLPTGSRVQILPLHAL